MGLKPVLIRQILAWKGKRATRLAVSHAVQILFPFGSDSNEFISYMREKHQEGKLDVFLWALDSANMPLVREVHLRNLSNGKLPVEALLSNAFGRVEVGLKWLEGFGKSFKWMQPAEPPAIM